jgi:hypothetical protein
MSHPGSKGIAYLLGDEELQALSKDVRLVCADSATQQDAYSTAQHKDH